MICVYVFVCVFPPFETLKQPTDFHLTWCQRYAFGRHAGMALLDLLIAAVMLTC